jgi:hypothetical protein
MLLRLLRQVLGRHTRAAVMALITCSDCSSTVTEGSADLEAWLPTEIRLTLRDGQTISRRSRICPGCAQRRARNWLALLALLALLAPGAPSSVRTGPLTLLEAQSSAPPCGWTMSTAVSVESLS